MRTPSLLIVLLLTACAASPGPVVPGAGTGAVLPSSSASGTPSLPGVDETGLGLTIPDDMKIEVFARNLPGARVMVRDNFGGIWVSRPSAGMVTLLEIGSGGTVTNQYDIFRGLKNPHGLAIGSSSVGSGSVLYIAEETSIKKAVLYSDAPVETIATLPAGGRHTSRTIEFGPDGRLYVSIGSTCDVCVEANEKHGTILSMNTDGTDQKIFARGLRNTVFFDWSYVTGDLFATDMGRDNLGDNLPPEEVNVITEGSHYGWPYCYGDRVRDTSFAGTFDCATTEPPRATLPAHIAPLGLAFVPEEGWPEEFWYDLLVSEHGSWNSTDPVGYKIVRIPMDANGNPDGEPVDFVSGFRKGSTVSGRPVDLMIEPGGTLYITDDKAGAIYRMTRTVPAM